MQHKCCKGAREQDRANDQDGQGANKGHHCNVPFDNIPRHIKIEFLFCGTVIKCLSSEERDIDDILPT
jgi:hypothetical protein